MNMDLDNNQEQPVMDSEDGAKQPNASDNWGSDTEVTLGDGTKVTLAELEKSYSWYKSLQSDYTRKSQELASIKKGWEEISEEDKQAIEALKKAWIATVDDIASFKAEQAQKEEFTHFSSEADLSETHLKAVQDLKKIHPDKSFWDIAKDYGFIDEAKLAKVKWSFGFKGKSFATPEKKEKYVVDVTKAGYNPEKAAELAKMKF